MATVGALVGWKFRAALVLGHVKSVDGDKLTITPVSKPASEVKRKREKVLLESELDPDDVAEAMKRHGHMARTATKSRGKKAQAVGLASPSQLMPEGEAQSAKRSREGEYKKEAQARKKAAPAKARGGRAGKGASPEAEAEEEEAPPTPKPPSKARSKAAAETPTKRGKKAAKAA